jgi:uncharacterized protein (DUF58 family)
MKLLNKTLAWIEVRGSVPAYGGWVLLGLVLCFWLAAANTMAGWLYVLSGLGIALLLLSALLPARTLSGIKIERAPIYPAHAGEPLPVSLTLHNKTAQSKGLLIVQDQIPAELRHGLASAVETAIDLIKPRSSHIWHYQIEPQHRGVYQWATVMLRTGAPLGLFWSRRQQSVPTRILIYPRIFPLQRCPLLDEADASTRQVQLQQILVSQRGQEGSTRSLRPYRSGDPMRLVHWRSSARYSELRVRELEQFNGGHSFVIALDLTHTWQPDQFEQAVTAAASLYTYALQYRGGAVLWTSHGSLWDKVSVLEALAQVQPQTEQNAIPNLAVVWLTANDESINHLPIGSRYVLWTSSSPTDSKYFWLNSPKFLGITVVSEKPLQVQLEAALQS